MVTAPTLFDVADGTSALLSPCERYRYTLTRSWDVTLPTLVWVMLNPSTADATKNDPTINKCRKFAERWGYGGIVVVNLFAVRATDPAKLVTFEDPVGPDNDEHIAIATRGRVVVCAWGASVPRTYIDRPAAVLDQLRQGARQVLHLGLTKDGHPKHPLYLAGSTEASRWTA